MPRVEIIFDHDVGEGDVLVGKLFYECNHFGFICKLRE